MAANKLIVIEGLDGSGKATQARRLMKALMEQGVSVREVSFPDYDSDSSALVRMYLSGQFGTDPQDVNAYAASSFFAVDRFMPRGWSLRTGIQPPMLCTSAASCRGSSGKVF